MDPHNWYLPRTGPPSQVCWPVVSMLFSVCERVPGRKVNTSPALLTSSEWHRAILIPWEIPVEAYCGWESGWEVPSSIKCPSRDLQTKESKTEVTIGFKNLSLRSLVQLSVSHSMVGRVPLALKEHGRAWRRRGCTSQHRSP